MFGLLDAIDEEYRIDRLEKKLGSAKIKGLTYCVKCGFCCNRRTCIPTPDELIKIAEYLKLNIKECINKYFAIDCNQMHTIYFLKPVGLNTKDLAGKFIPSDRTFNEGACIFLDENKMCKIHKVKPKSAKGFNCWEKIPDYDAIIHWKDNQLLKIFKIDGEQEDVI